MAWPGYAASSVSMIAASAAWSTSVTKSFGDLVLTFSRSRSSEARLMIAPAARAALMAMLSMGCRACDMGVGALGDDKERRTTRGPADNPILRSASADAVAA